MAKKCIWSCDLLMTYYFLKAKIMSSVGQNSFTGQCGNSSQKNYKLFKMPIAQQPLELYVIF